MEVVPAGMLLGGPDNAEELSLSAASEGAAGLASANPLAMGLSGPLGWCGIARPARTAA